MFEYRLLNVFHRLYIDSVPRAARLCIARVSETPKLIFPFVFPFYKGHASLNFKL